jgi:dihydroorotate dehydrogenase
MTTLFENHPLYPGESVPLFISAGVLKYPAQVEPFMEVEDVSVVPALNFGSFTLPEWSGNAKAGQTDFIYYPHIKAAGNAIGLRNPGEPGLRDLKRTIKRLGERGITTITSVTNLPHEKPIDVIPELVAIAADNEPTAVEINLSCPNGKKPDGSFHPQLCYDADASGEVLEAARDRVGRDICLGVKDAPHTSSLEEDVDSESISRLAFRIRDLVDFVTGINTIGNQPFPEIDCAGGRGGMSGPVVAPVAKQHLKIWREVAPDLAYLSCGGVESSNAESEIAERLGMDALRVGGAQEFYRARQPHRLAIDWAIKFAQTVN